MAVPKFFEFFMPVVHCLSNGAVMHVKEIRDACIAAMGLTDEDVQQMLPSEKQPTVNNRIHWALQYLKKAGLIQSARRGYYSITLTGREAFTRGEKIDLKYLEQFPSFLEFHPVKRRTEGTQPDEPETPVESFEDAFEKINNALEDELLTAVMTATPAFFEHFVVDLLLKVGYGGAFEKAGIVTKISGDGGIDGIIREDQLGFSSIYIQAKRWNPDQTVGRPEVQKFAGALLGQGAAKGLFITTAKFSNEAVKYADDISSPTSRIVLIDGKRLTKLMLTYNVGVTVQRVYEIKKIDSDYFIEE